MSEDTLETIGGYEEKRDPLTAVKVSKWRSERYHELRPDGSIACGGGSGSNFRKISLKKAINQWNEPCGAGPCEDIRESGEEFHYVDPEEDGESDGNYVVETKWKDKEKIDRAYWDYYWSTLEIAEWAGVDSSEVSSYMEEVGIPRRSAEEAGKIHWIKKKGQRPSEASPSLNEPNREAKDTIVWSDVEGDVDNG